MRITTLRLNDIGVTFFFFILAYLSFTHTLINGDVAWHIEAARRIFQGENYLSTVFDTNSPFVFAIFIPPIILNKLFGWPLLKMIFIYFTLWCGYSLLLCYQLLKYLYPSNLLKQRLIYLSIVFITVLLPQDNYAQREVFLVWLYLPYFLLTALTFTTPLTSSKLTMLKTCPVLAAFGLMQNICYLPVPIILDIYKWIKHRRFEQHQALFYLTIGLFCGLLNIYYPEYFHTIAPMVLLYESGLNFPILILFVNFSVFTIITSLILAYFFRKKVTNDAIFSYTVIATVVTLLIYLIEKKLWYYHLYPALSFALLLLCLLLGTALQNRQSSALISLFCSFYLTLGIGIFYDTYQQISKFYNTQSKEMRWINYVQQSFDNKKIFMLQFRLSMGYSPLFYSHMINITPWSNPWLLPYVVINQKKLRPNSGIFRNLVILNKMMARAFTNSRPDYYLSEIINWPVDYQGTQFSYYNFFTTDNTIKTCLDQYHLNDIHSGFFIFKKNNHPLKSLGLLW